MCENIILEIGSERFSRVLFSEVQRPLGLRQIVAYRFSPGRKVELLFAESADDEENMRRVIKDYSENLYDRDPILNECRPRAIRETRVHHVVADAIPDATFRDTLYRAQKMASKTAIVVRRPNEALAIGFFRGEDAGEMSGQQWDFIEKSAACIAAAVERHFQLTTQKRDAGWSSILAGIETQAPLSKREIVVCSYILDGYFNEAIALNMGISVHSVITYRRRAFAKLGISSQGQLYTRIIRNGSN